MLPTEYQIGLTLQQRIWNSTKHVCQNVFAKVMNSWKSHLFRKRPPSQIFDRAIKTPLVCTSRSFHFNLLYIKDKNKILWWSCTRFYEIVVNYSSICITYLVLYIIKRLYVLYSILKLCWIQLLSMRDWESFKILTEKS